MRQLRPSARIRAIAISTTVGLFVQLLAVPLRASESFPMAAQIAPGRATAENMQVAFSRGVVTITYDLVSPEGQGTFDVTLEVSTNGGQTYEVQPRSIEGDIGSTVSAGRSKRVVWEAGKDVENLQIDQFRFRVVIRVMMRPGAPAPPPAADPQRPLGVPPLTPPATPTLPRQRSSGNRLLWPGLSVFGAGAALVTLAAAGPLRKRTDYQTYYELTPNTPVIIGGVGVAAAGALLILVGKRGAKKTAVVVPIPGGVMLYRATTF